MFFHYAHKEVSQGQIFLFFDFIINPFSQKMKPISKQKSDYLHKPFFHKKNELNWISLKAISDKISLEVVALVVVVVVVILSKELQYLVTSKRLPRLLLICLYSRMSIFFLRKENIIN